MSEVTAQYQAVPATRTIPVASPGIRQPATTPIRVFINMDERMFDVGYGSDGELRPFFIK